MKKLILTIALTALLLIVGQAAQAEPYQLPVRVHTLVACNQGALALTYTGEVFYIAGDNAAVVQITPRFFEGELVYLEGICSGANGMFYTIAYGDDEPHHLPGHLGRGGFGSFAAGKGRDGGWELSTF